MPSVALAPILAMALAAPSSGMRESMLVALGPSPARAIQETSSAALPPAPENAVLETATFGTITLDHRAHLARRTPCKDCHGPGPVSKLGRLPPKVAHDRCVTCHRDGGRGPTVCRDCHVKQAPATEAESIQAGLTPPAEAGPAITLASAAGPQPLAATPSYPAAVLAQFEADRHRELVDRARNPFMRTLGIGFSVTGGAGREVTSGPALYMSTREGQILLLYGLEHGSGAGGSQTRGLIGAGLTQRIIAGWSAQALLVGGFDAMEGPTAFSPILGLRTGVEWLGRHAFVSVAGTAASDVVSTTNKVGQQTGGLGFSLSANVGYVIARD